MKVQAATLQAFLICSTGTGCSAFVLNNNNNHHHPGWNIYTKKAKKVNHVKFYGMKSEKAGTLYMAQEDTNANADEEEDGVQDAEVELDDDESDQGGETAVITSEIAEIVANTATSTTTTTNLVKTPYRPPLGEAYKHGQFPSVPELITLDAVGTVIQLRSEVGIFYRDILMEATDFNARLPSPAVFTTAFREAFKEQDEAYPCFGCGQGITSKQWWRTVVKRTYDLVEEIDFEDYLREELEGPLGEAVFEALYSDVFMTSEAWELRTGVLEALSRFSMWRENGGPKLAILTNSDERIHSIIENLGISDAFDFILTSREIGAAKPSRSAFEVAMSRLGLTDPSQCMHVGDGFSTDVEGASAAGWHAVYIPEDGQNIIPENTSDELVFSMVGDLFSILDMYGQEPDYRLILTTRNIDERGNYMDHQKLWSTDSSDTADTIAELPTPKSWEGPGRF